MTASTDPLPGADVTRLQRWIADTVPGTSGDLRVEMLAGGASNLTFRVGDDAHEWVLRRPPVAHVLATAHDMGREFRVQEALADTGVPVPRMVAECRDPDVIGAPFYLMEFEDGVVYSDAAAVAHLSPADAREVSYELVEVLARLHSVDPDSVGLADLGRPEGYLHRQVVRWRRQWEQSRREDLPALDEVAARVECAIPRRSSSGLVHGDYSLNNVLYHREEPGRVQAVLDWEMATLGDPLTDVGMLLTYWGPVGDLIWRGRGSAPQRSVPGFLTSDELAERYATTGGVDVSDLDFYQVLATYKLAVITAGVYARRLETDPDAAARTGRLLHDLADAALAQADASPVPALNATTASRSGSRSRAEH